MNNQDSDEALMLRYQKGDNQAFDLLFNRHKDAIFRYLERQCVKTIAEEIFQDVWMRLVQARDQFQPTESSRFTTYIYKIAHNRLMDYFRHKSVQERVISDAHADDLDQLPVPTQVLPDMQLDTQRKITKLTELIQELSSDQREAFLLREESGFSIQEIADITGVNRETAKSRLRYAFVRLRDGMRGLT